MPNASIWGLGSLICMLLAEVPIIAQVYPGQYPPGQYPAGQYPPGQQGPGIPNPFPRRKKSQDSKDQNPAEKYTKTSGILVDVRDNDMSVQTPDKRVLIFKAQSETKVTSGDKTIALSDLGYYDEVVVESKTDADNNMLAVSVKLIKRGDPNAAAAAGAEAEGGGGPPSTILQREDPPASSATDPPKLKRGVPAKNAHDDDLEKEVERDAANSPSAKLPGASPTNSEEASLPPNAPQPGSAPMADDSMAPLPSVRDKDPFIGKARVAAGETLEKLPNFVCDQFTTRYMSDRRPAEWQAQDVVSAKVVYEDGKETYQNVKLNNKPVKDPAKAGNGAWSAGEFGTVLADLFSPATATNFHSGMNTTLNGKDARVYDFEVDQEHSHWKIMPPSQYYFPAYKGSIWLDKESGRALRIESGAVDIPKEFPFDAVESAVDYDYVSIGTQKALLPVKAEVLICQRSSSICSRNVIEFRNYHKFGSESEIKFGP